MLACISSAGAVYSQYSLKKVWATDTVLATPESVLFWQDKNLLLVSLMNIKFQQAEKRGAIGIITPTGEIIDTGFITGLRSPKGMGIYNDFLYIADVSEVVKVSLSSKKILNRILLDSAVMLNDITIDEEGRVFISDTRTGKVHVMQNDIVSEYLTGLTNPNGLLALNNNLYVLASGSLYKADSDKNLKTIATGMESSTDGIIQVAEREFIVSCWSGVIYQVNEDGMVKELLDSRKEKINTADIGYNAKEKIMYVPTFFKNNVLAFSIK